MEESQAISPSATASTIPVARMTASPLCGPAVSDLGGDITGKHRGGRWAGSDRTICWRSPSGEAPGWTFEEASAAIEELAREYEGAKGNHLRLKPVEPGDLLPR